MSFKINAAALLAVFHVLCLILVQSLDYNEIEMLGMSCYPKDSCNRDIRLPFRDRSCECDNVCDRFDDCCIDASRNRRRSGGSRNRRIVEIVECLEYETDWGVYAVSTCPQSYDGPIEIRTKCEELYDISNPPAAVPTTDIVLNVTYKNHYCAECNSADPTNLRSWDIGIECNDYPATDTGFDENSTYVEDHLTFRNNTEGQADGWGFYYPEDEEDPEREFYPCEIPFRFPNYLSEFVRFCRANLISSCPTSWRRQVIREKCESYMAVVYIGNKIYKNPHCVMCNSETATVGGASLCTIPPKTILSRGKKPPLSFTLLMDVNSSEGDRVGMVRDNRCPNGKRWDSFARKCRRLVCAIPSYVKRNGQCVPP